MAQSWRTAKPAWRTAKPSWQSARRKPRPKRPSQPSNVSFNGVLWMTFGLTIVVFFMFA